MTFALEKCDFDVILGTFISYCRGPKNEPLGSCVYRPKCGRPKAITPTIPGCSPGTVMAGDFGVKIALNGHNVLRPKGPKSQRQYDT